MSLQLTPNLLAAGTIRPHRFVTVDTGADNKALEANHGEAPVGVTTGSNLEFDSDNHATTTEGDDSVQLQPGAIVNVKCGGTVTRGHPIGPDNDGFAVHGAGGYAIALESGTVGAVIRAMMLAPGLNYLPVENFTADDTLTVYESGKVVTNLGATGAVTLTLPQNATAGCWFIACVLAAQQLRIDPGAAGAFYFGGAKQTDDKYIWADDEAESMIFVSLGNGDWMAMALVGTWTVQT